MQIVINIPKVMYINAKRGLLFGAGILVDAIKNGTPLPKGHGALKDADAICKDTISALGIRDENYLLEAEKAVYKRIKNAPTIIEADKAESEESD